MRKNYSVENYPPRRVKVKGIPSQASSHAVIPALLTLLLLTTSCMNDGYDAVPQAGGGVAVELSIVTRAITSNSQTYEVGTTWENYIDIAGGDYRIYFFANDKDDAAATSDSERNTLIAEFLPSEMTAVEGSTYTQYTLSGNVGEDIIAYSGFKVVVLANWGAYPTVTAGETTIDSLVEGSNTTFSAETFFDGVDESHLIPFYGVREYSGVKWRQGWRTTLNGDISLLRAVAKIEVILTEESDVDIFDSVSIVRYNTSGYCAPKGVYLRSDYDHDYTWEQDFTSSPHLVGGSNVSLGLLTHTFNRQSGSDTDVWTIYLPEYANMSGTGTAAEDCSHIVVTVGGAEYEIHFANYDEDGEAANTADYDIFRNCLYRFHVTVESENGYFRVSVNDWDECFNNEFTFDAE